MFTAPGAITTNAAAPPRGAAGTGCWFQPPGRYLNNESPCVCVNACMAALNVSREACREFALAHSWKNSARQFIGNLSQLQTGRVMRLKGRGIPGRGAADVRARIRVAARVA